MPPSIRRTSNPRTTTAAASNATPTDTETALTPMQASRIKTSTRALVRTGPRSKKPTKTNESENKQNKAAASIFASTKKKPGSNGKKSTTVTTADDSSPHPDADEKNTKKTENTKAPPPPPGKHRPRRTKVVWKTVPAPGPFYFISFMVDQRNTQYPWAVTRQRLALATKVQVQGAK